LTAKARSTVRDLDPNNELVFLRIKSRNNEILVAPDKDFMLIVVQGKQEKAQD
jgi:dynein light chain roadblock-type